jgi:hypothetical protein
MRRTRYALPASIRTVIAARPLDELVAELATDYLAAVKVPASEATREELRQVWRLARRNDRDALRALVSFAGLHYALAPEVCRRMAKAAEWKTAALAEALLAS